MHTILNERKPAYFIEVWRGPDEGINYHEITEIGYAELQEKFEQKRIINGQAATVYVFFDDNEISMVEILKTATAFMKGGWVTTEIDLDKCVSSKYLAIGKLNPRQ